MSFSYFSKNGVILPLTEATIPLENIAYQYGFGVYETLKVRGGVLYFSKQHVQRLEQSAKLLGLSHTFSAEKITNYMSDIVQKNHAENCNIKMLLIGGKSATDALLFIIPLAPLFPNRKLYTHGASVNSVQFERFLPNAKTLNMLRSYLYYSEASSLGNYDVLFLDKNQNILEGSRTNFFAIKDSILFTPPKAKVLEGVTRQTVIAVAKNCGYTVKERRIHVSELETFDGAFLTSTSTKIIPLVKIDQHRYQQIPEMLKKLIKHYDQFLDDCNGVFNL